MGLLLVILLIAIYAQSRDIQLFINSDTLYLPSIFLDLFVHGSGLKGWHLNASPNFFPDMISYMGLMGILKQTALTSLVFSALQFAAVMVLLYFMMKTWSPDTDLESHTVLGMVMLLFLVSPILGEDPLIVFQLLVPSYHCGFFINILLAMIAGMQYLRKGNIWWLVGAGMVSLLAALSDRLFLIGFVFPLLVLVILTAIRNIREYRYYILLAVVMVSSLLGMGIFRLLELGDSLHFIGTDWKMFNFSNMGASFSHLVDYLVTLISDHPLQRWLIILMLLFSMAAPVYLILRLRAFLKNRLDRKQMQQYILILFLFVHSMALLFTPVINGSFLGPAHIRYNYPALILGALGAVYMLLSFLKERRHVRKVTGYVAIIASSAILIILVISGFRHHALRGTRDFVRHYPEKSEVLDRLKESHGLTYGIANYWHAKHSTIFSRNDIRVYSVFDEDLKPYYHVTNENWYHDGGKGRYADPVFNFIYADAGYNTPDKLMEYFGDRMDTIYARQGAIVIKLPPFRIDRVTRAIVPLDQVEEE